MLFFRTHIVVDVVIFLQALTIYWSTTNVISVVQASLVRTPALRKKLGIPPFKRHAQTEVQKKGFVQAMKDGMQTLIVILKMDFHDCFIDFCSR